MQEVSYGEMQHGHMDQVGYEMYCRLLDEVIKECRGDILSPANDASEFEIIIDINASSYIPDDFTDSNSVKIELYQNIALCKDEEDIESVIDEIIDRFGKLPIEVENLLNVARIKNLCRNLRYNKSSTKK